MLRAPPPRAPSRAAQAANARGKTAAQPHPAERATTDDRRAHDETPAGRRGAPRRQGRRRPRSGRENPSPGGAAPQPRRGGTPAPQGRQPVLYLKGTAGEGAEEPRAGAAAAGSVATEERGGRRGATPAAARGANSDTSGQGRRTEERSDARKRARRRGERSARRPKQTRRRRPTATASRRRASRAPQTTAQT